MRPEPADVQPPSEDDWLIVPNWGKFQHYRNRNPAWIKVYSQLLHDPDYLGLSLASKGLLVLVWLSYSSTDEQLTVRSLRRLARDKFGFPQLLALNHAGFLSWSASKPLAPKKEKEKEREKNPSYSLTDKDAVQALLTRALDVAADWTGGTSDQFDETLDALEREFDARLSTIQRISLWDEALKRDPGKS